MKIVIVENPRPLTMEHYNDVANAPLSASLNSGYALAVARRAGRYAASMATVANAKATTAKVVTSSAVTPYRVPSR